jgi:hypothetical protein
MLGVDAQQGAVREDSGVRQMKRLLVALVLLWPATGAAAPPAQEWRDKIISEARSDCEPIGGKLSLTDEAVLEIDLTGDGKPETLIDTSNFSCPGASTVMSPFCGMNAGCSIYVLADGQTFRWFARGWKVVEWEVGGLYGSEPFLVVLLLRHGRDCGGDNTRDCIEALTWTEGRFSSVRKR